MFVFFRLSTWLNLCLYISLCLSASLLTPACLLLLPQSPSLPIFCLSYLSRFLNLNCSSACLSLKALCSPSFCLNLGKHFLCIWPFLLDWISLPFSLSLSLSLSVSLSLSNVCQCISRTTISLSASLFSPPSLSLSLSLSHSILIARLSLPVRLSISGSFPLYFSPFRFPSLSMLLFVYLYPPPPPPNSTYHPLPFYQILRKMLPHVDSIVIHEWVSFNSANCDYVHNAPLCKITSLQNDSGGGSGCLMNKQIRTVCLSLM